MKAAKIRSASALIAFTTVLLVLVSASPAAAQVTLGSTVGSFGVLGGSTVTNTGSTIVNGNLGVSPGSSVTGFPPGVVVGGTIHSNDATAIQAQTELTTAYNTVAGTPCTLDLSGQNLGGLARSLDIRHSARVQRRGAGDDDRECHQIGKRHSHIGIEANALHGVRSLFRLFDQRRWVLPL